MKSVSYTFYLHSDSRSAPTSRPEQQDIKIVAAPSGTGSVSASQNTRLGEAGAMGRMLVAAVEMQRPERSSGWTRGSTDRRERHKEKY